MGASPADSRKTNFRFNLCRKAKLPLRRRGLTRSRRSACTGWRSSRHWSTPSAILLTGLILNATVGWWWADPIAALAIAALAVNEGREAWRGESCEDCR